MSPDQLRDVRSSLTLDAHGNVRTRKRAAETPLTQADFAKALGVTRDAVQSWETGRRPISRVVALAVKHLTCK